MRLNRPLALAILFVTLVPWAFFVYILTTFASSFPTMPVPGAPPEEVFQQFQSVFRIQMLVMLLLVALLVFYIVHLFNTQRVPADKKALWAVVLLLGNLFAMRVYWYFYMWPTSPKGAA